MRLTRFSELFAAFTVATAIAGCNTSTSTTSTPSESSATTGSSSGSSQTAKPSEAPSVNRTEPAESSVSNTCAGEVRAGAHTSCQFAEAVHSAFTQLESTDGVPPAEVKAYSPVTKQHYSLQCVLIASRTDAECTTGTAVVSFPLHGKEAPKPEGTETPRSEGTEEGEDKVGSSTHAGDTKFCSEHQCIGSFTTEGGTVVECSDGTFSHAGGIQGACSHHGGVGREE
jgi:hypothetical protein